MTELNHAQLQRDTLWMHQALVLARKGLLTTAPNPAVGCLLVKDEQCIAEGWHQRAGEPHAEVHALAAAGDRARGATAYVTLEPCSHHGRTPPCAEALISAGIARVVVAMEDPNPQVAGSGITRLREAGIAVTVGVLSSAAERLNRGFCARMRRNRPWLTVKLAASLDARVALENGESQWITAAAARRDVQYFRAQADAILTGAETVLRDNPRLNVRAEQWPLSRPQPELLRQPIKVVIDSQRRVPSDAQIFAGQSPVWLAQTVAERSDLGKQAEVIVCQAHDGRVDLHDLLAQLAKRGINQIWTECGPQLAGALLAAKLVDELIIYQAAAVIGDHGQPLLRLPKLGDLAKQQRFEVVDQRAVGDDWRTIYRPRYDAADV
ncbi:riboflavin biosynthesis protein RibD [Idiomarina tyrosinivorans]|uniref:Riboflavin biosynthesis protein RibD n=1 Tax=Idiomarina tyrosinivorans TaxID=1445662 RepID=A0A432ZLD3_9GAMM|nr:bifunctional diaminohydroxyphosphoribosylaminopyrimidine deaminase/5-amino-6-(5-phosphoribosylamino)uracil reductase RibD [Idiomarina tyrosinivorans]RUO78786.1 riboflavin biosynthesis protein RibD [Idiomarina tyrosinivorans]